MSKPLCLIWLGMALLGLSSGAELCTIDAVPAATLLLPYFEVGLMAIPEDPVASDRQVDTFFSINNASASPAAAHVTLWANWSLPSINFDIFLAGYDIQTVSLSNLLNGGNLPAAARAFQHSSLDQPGSNAALTFNEGLLKRPLRRPRRGHTGRSIGSFLGQPCDPDDPYVACGYLTIDNVSDGNLLFPNQAGYFGSGLTQEVNQLWGDWFIVEDDRAIGDQLVPIEASSEGFFSPGDYTFYGRYVDGLATDQREPLATTWAIRYLQPGPLVGAATELLIWRDSKCQNSATSFEGSPPWFPLDEAQVVAFDTQEDAYEICGSSSAAESGGSNPACFPTTAGRYAPGEGFLNVPFDFGWMFLNLNFTLGDTSGSPYPCTTDGLFGDLAQSWVASQLDTTSGAFSVGFAGTQLTSACSSANPLIQGDLGGDL